MKMKRFLCVYLPHWSIEVAKNLLQRTTPKSSLQVVDNKLAAHDARPLILISTIAQQSIVKRFCLRAALAGVKLDTPVNLAQALTHSPIIAPFKPLQDYRALFRFALRALAVSPLVALDNDLRKAFLDGSLAEIAPEYSGFMLDISGTERLHRGEEQLARRLFKALEARGITGRIAIASNIGCAWANSRYAASELTIVANKDVRSSLLPLPIASFRFDPAVTNALAELGLYTVDALLRLQVKDVGLRFGVHSLRRMHQALGSVDEHFEALASETEYSVTRKFEIPIENLSAAQEITLQLLRSLLINLNLYGLKAGSFLITFTTRTIRGETGVHKKEIALQSASNATDSIMHIVAPVIESFKVPGGIVLVSVLAQVVVCQLSEQQQMFESPCAQELKRNSEEFLNTLTARLGAEQVQQVTLHESHIPERSFSYAPIVRNQVVKEAAPLFSIIQEGNIPTRPPQIFTHAERISALALLPDRPPARIEWRGTQYKILAGRGPERIAPEWWRNVRETSANNSFSRDYFTLQDHTGRWLWVYRNLQNLEWWIHGVW